MKYMGSKRWMLLNGLGDLLTTKGGECKRFIDLFAGSGAVSTFVASKHNVPCFAYDIQLFSVVLNGAILARSSKLNHENIWEKWEGRAKVELGSAFDKTPRRNSSFTKAYVYECRKWCNVRRGKNVTSSYGGHYFSPEQALWIDALRATLPADPSERLAGLAALIQAASQCAASPGHTAQPFQPTSSAKKFIEEAWRKGIAEKTKAALTLVCNQHALCTGEASVRDANEAAKHLKEGDLVFLDPPYSGVHYSRFYHVLETIAQGTCSEVTGTGRYPRVEERPISKYSIGSKAPTALDELLKTLAEVRANAILTFPSHKCSNGLSGAKVKETASKYFCVKEKIVESKFSTLGGNNGKSSTNNKRAARHKVYELILLLSPLK